MRGFIGVLALRDWLIVAIVCCLLLQLLWPQLSSATPPRDLDEVMLESLGAGSDRGSVGPTLPGILDMENSQSISTAESNAAPRSAEKTGLKDFAFSASDPIENRGDQRLVAPFQHVYLFCL